MKLYITKYALTSGVFIAQGTHGEGMAKVKRPGGTYDEYFHGEDWHATSEGAKLRVEMMRLNAIKLTEKKLDKLRAMKITVPE